MTVFTLIGVTVLGVAGLFSGIPSLGIILAIAAAAACIVDELESLRRELRDTRDEKEKRG